MMLNILGVCNHELSSCPIEYTYTTFNVVVQIVTKAQNHFELQ